MSLPVPQAELPVVATGEEAVLGRVGAESPELVSVALQWSSEPVTTTLAGALPSPTTDLDDRREALGQVSSQQRVPCGPHQQLGAWPLGDGPHSTKVLWNLHAETEVWGQLAATPTLLGADLPSPLPPGGPPTLAPTAPAGGPGHHHSAPFHPVGDTERR